MLKSRANRRCLCVSWSTMLFLACVIQVLLHLEEEELTEPEQVSSVVLDEHLGAQWWHEMANRASKAHPHCWQLKVPYKYNPSLNHLRDATKVNLKNERPGKNGYRLRMRDAMNKELSEQGWITVEDRLSESDWQLKPRLSVVVMAYQSSPALFEMLDMYQTREAAAIIAQIILVWNNIYHPPNPALMRAILARNESVPVRVIQQRSNSLLNRWTVVGELEHSPLIKQGLWFFTDDDQFVSPSQLACLRRQWMSLEDPTHKVVGLMNGLRQFSFTGNGTWKYRRSAEHWLAALCGMLESHNDRHRLQPFHFEMTLPRLLVPHSMAVRVSEMIQSDLFADARRIIREQDGHCDDVLLSLILHELNQGRPFLHLISDVVDLNLVRIRTHHRQLAAKGKRFDLRSQCLTLLISALPRPSVLAQHSLLKHVGRCEDDSAPVHFRLFQNQSQII